VQPANRMLGRHISTVPAGKPFRSCRRNQLEPHAIGVSKAQDLLAEPANGSFVADARPDQPSYPEAQRALGDQQGGDRRLSASDQAAGAVRPGKECQNRSGPAYHVPEIEVIGRGVVIVHRPFYQPETQHSTIEVDRPVDPAGDGGDVVNAAGHEERSTCS